MIASSKVLFVNFAVSNCGVHHYGENLFSVLASSKRFSFEYADILNLEDLDLAVERGGFVAVLVNYHPQTLPFIQIDMPRRYAIPCIAVMHEMTQTEADNMPRRIFQYYVMGDPTLRQNNNYVFSTGRIIPRYENKNPLPAITTVGSFGFSVGSKGYQRLVDAVQEEFDEAIIRINIPANGIIDQDGGEARRQIDLCRARLWKPGIQLKATHEFFDNAQLTDFLATNTLNAFLYDYVPQAGISSSTDHALAARRPIAITQSIMFRHLLDLQPPITIENSCLKEIISNGTRAFNHLLREWAPERICVRYEEIIAEVASHEDLATTTITESSTMIAKSKILKTGKRIMKLFRRVVRSILRRSVQYVLRPFIFSVKSAVLNLWIFLGLKKPRNKFNRILDDYARIEYAGTISRLTGFTPEIMAKKIPRANVQQAFIFDAVRSFAPKFANPKILCVGSFEDSAAVSLKHLGYAVEEIDPVINQLDLKGFYRLPTTKPRTYDIIFSTSVLEHVKDDEQFMMQMADLLAPGGIGILTCDFKEGYKVGDPVIAGDYRFYTKQDLLQRVLAKLKDCTLVDSPQWDCSSPDFDLGGFKYTFATLVFRKSNSDDFSVSWDKLSPTEQARFYDENGFLVIPASLSADQVNRAIQEIQQFGLSGTTEEIWRAPFASELVINQKLLSALTAIFGNDIRFFKGVYVESPPDKKAGTRQIRKPLHVDYGIGEPEGDFRNSAASWVNVAFYLTDLTSEHAPLWVVPGSNRTYAVVPASDLEHFQDQAKMVLARAGDAVLFHGNTVHAASHNCSTRTRHALFFSYRPAWAKPAGLVKEWPEAFVESFSAEHRSLLRNLNVGL